MKLKYQEDWTLWFKFVE